MVACYSIDRYHGGTGRDRADGIALAPKLLAVKGMTIITLRIVFL